jgi:hypothetical protein
LLVESQKVSIVEKFSYLKRAERVGHSGDKAMGSRVLNLGKRTQLIRNGKMLPQRARTPLRDPFEEPYALCRSALSCISCTARGSGPKAQGSGCPAVWRGRHRQVAHKQTLLDRIEDDAHVRIRLQCSPYHTRAAQRQLQAWPVHR